MNNYNPNHTTLLHYVFTTKYRFTLLDSPIRTALDNLIRQVCDELSLELVALAIQPEHVHFLTWQPRSRSAASIAHRIKGRAAHDLRQQFPHLLAELPALWGRRYFVRAVGGGRANVQRYIEAQHLGDNS